MKIEILGTGCPNCEKLYKTVNEIVDEAGIEAHVCKVTDMQAIINKGVFATPALVVDGEMKVSGRVPSRKELERWIKD